MKKSLFVAVLVTLAVFLVACGGGEGIVGKWESVYVMEGEASFKMVGAMTLDVKADNTFSGNSSGEQGEGTWKKDGDKYIMTVEGNDAEATIEKGLLKVQYGESSKMYFSKDAKNFKDFPEGALDMMDMGGDKEEKKDEEK